jgi:hypothetical protein
MVLRLGRWAEAQLMFILRAQRWGVAGVREERDVDEEWGAQ